jgi:hypothetical protein
LIVGGTMRIATRWDQRWRFFDGSSGTFKSRMRLRMSTFKSCICLVEKRIVDQSRRIGALPVREVRIPERAKPPRGGAGLGKARLIAATSDRRGGDAQSVRSVDSDRGRCRKDARECTPAPGLEALGWHVTALLIGPHFHRRSGAAPTGRVRHRRAGLSRPSRASIQGTTRK